MKKKKKTSSYTKKKTVRKNIPENSSPVCFSESEEVREEYKEKPEKKSDN